MPTLVIPKTYRDGRPPRVIDLDNIRLTLETFFNTTKLDHTNIDLAAISAVISASQSRTLITSSECGSTSSSEEASSADLELTIVDSGVYAIYLYLERSTTAGPTVSGDFSLTSDINIEINGVTEYTVDNTVTIATDTGNDFSLINYDGAPLVFVRSLTQGDIITVSGSTEVGIISAIKLLET